MNEQLLKVSAPFEKTLLGGWHSPAPLPHPHPPPLYARGLRDIENSSAFIELPLP